MSRVCPPRNWLLTSRRSIRPSAASTASSARRDFNGKKLLDGSQAVNVTGVDSTKLDDVTVYNRKSSSDDTDITLSLDSAATKATSTGYATTSATAATSISITGKLGTAVIDIGAGEDLDVVAQKIADASAQTGVTASATADNKNLSLISTEYGSDAFVTVQNLSGDNTNFADVSKTTGDDAAVKINGQEANVDGLNVNYNGGGISLSFTLTEGYNDGTVNGAETFKVTDGGATFQLGTDSSTRSTIGLAAMYGNMLGSADVGYLSSIASGGTNSLSKDPTAAVSIIKRAVQQVALVRGRVGGFQKYQVDTSVNALKASQQALTNSMDSINAVDYAETSSDLSRQQVLMNAAVSLLGIANSQSQSVLSLLR